MITGLRTLIQSLAGGSALGALASVVLSVCSLILALLYRRYLGILGADRRRPAERQVYDGLRNNLVEGNLAARLYADRLTRFLDWIDHFFGDAGMAEQTLFPHAFGLRTPAPLWTAPAADCCLFLALLYPIATISVIWAISGHVGRAETAFHLQEHLFWWDRMSVAVATGLLISGGWQVFGRGTNFWKKLPWIVAEFVGLSVLVARGALTLVIYGMAVAICLGYISNFPAVRKGVLGVIAVSCAIGLSGGGGDWYVIVAGTGSGALYFTNKVAVRAGLEGIFYLILFPLMISTLLLAAKLLSPLSNWEYTGPALLFLGLVTLLIASFDWASLGLTRSLLRRGLELGGWWPYALALVDAALAAVIIAALALTMLVGVQAFDGLAVHGSGTAVLPLEPLLKGIVERPTAPEYWWLYALLLSTMLPSLVNLVIGGTSLVRGFPRVPSLLLRFIPERGDVFKWDRHWIATVLTAQVAAGAALGIAAQVFLVVVIIGYIMPWVGADLLDMAREVAAFNLPARVGHLFGANL